MTDEVGVIISSQTYGETLAANQIAYLKSDGSVNGAVLYQQGDIVAKCGFGYRFKVPTADFVATTSITGRFA